MINLNEPLELDDGTPVTLTYQPRADSCYVVVSMNSSPVREEAVYDDVLDIGVDPEDFGYYNDPYRPNEGSWSYNINTGIFSGGNARLMKVLRNATTAPSEYEEWFA